MPKSGKTNSFFIWTGTKSFFVFTIWKESLFTAHHSFIQCCGESALLIMRIRIQLYLNADPNPDPDQDPWSQTNADTDPDPGQTIKSQKIEYFNNIFKLVTGNKSKNLWFLWRYKSPFERQETRLIGIVFFVNFWIRIRFPNTNPQHWFYNS